MTLSSSRPGAPLSRDREPWWATGDLRAALIPGLFMTPMLGRGSSDIDLVVVHLVEALRDSSEALRLLTKTSSSCASRTKPPAARYLAGQIERVLVAGSREASIGPGSIRPANASDWDAESYPGRTHRAACCRADLARAVHRRERRSRGELPWASLASTDFSQDGTAPNEKVADAASNGSESRKPDSGSRRHQRRSHAVESFEAAPDETPRFDGATAWI